MSAAYLLVISNVVPKIWARTNSAMIDDYAPWGGVIGRWIAAEGVVVLIRGCV